MRSSLCDDDESKFEKVLVYPMSQVLMMGVRLAELNKIAIVEHDQRVRKMKIEQNKK